MSILRAARASALFAVTLVFAGCTHTEFVASVPSYVVHRSAQRPTVYFDRLPERPFASVGIIDVIAPTASSLVDVFDAAADKGQEVGCDVVVDRAIYRAAGAELPRWRIATLEFGAPPATPPARGELGYASAGVTPPAVGAVPPPPGAPTVVYAPTYSPPPDRREFICGVWVNAPVPPPPPPPPVTTP